jgi:hypothetical protein
MSKKRWPERWSSLPLRVRAWRRIRYLPGFVRSVAYYYSQWAFRGFPVDVEWEPTRADMAKFYLTICRSGYQCKCGIYWTAEELLADYQDEGPQS